ncbi:MAG TPA: NAD(P)/FAD-dependent oxidoreductase [Caulobacterales bacterium]|nr:NAD(P)/FAD-dependent oxidoreductase [Caulobacterales bacterium]
MDDAYDVLVLGGGAAGVAAARRLADAGASVLIVEARDRLGGRGLTNIAAGLPLDMGCGWLHSADHNIWRAQAERMGFHVEHAPAPWNRQSGSQGFTSAEQEDFRAAFGRFQARVDAEAEQSEARAASFFLEADCRWNPLLNAVFTYISGAALDCIDARDYARYDDSGINWRVREGYGALIAAYGAGLPVLFDAPVAELDHSGAVLRVTTAKGVLNAKAAIVTLPTSVLPRLKLTPDLPEKRAAAEGLPLGHAEKLFFALAKPEEFPADGHWFGHIDRVDTGSYHLRPLGRPIVECYFGGNLAEQLARAGAAAMADFALQELGGLIGASAPRRLAPLAASHWATEPHALGSYSYAKPGRAEDRAVLAASVDNRVFFAGEACSRERYSTAHGAFETGVTAAEQALSALGLHRAGL